MLRAISRAAAAVATALLPLAFGATLAAAQAATATTLDVFPSTTVASGTPVELLATVQSGGVNLPFGVVTFCDATAKSCTGSAMLGQVELTNAPYAGTAAVYLRMGIGTHKVKAVFSPQRNYATSLSTTQTITVTGNQSTVTTISSTGSAGAYSLTAKVKSTGRVAPTGPVSFLDGSDGNFSLGTAQLSAPATSSSLQNLNVFNVYGEAPVSMAVADFNLDGIPDIAVVDYLDDYVEVVYGDGHGGVLGVAAIAGLSNAWSLAVGDFNGDGIPDIAVADSFSKVHILQIDFTYSSLVEVSSQDTGNGNGYIAVGDFNNDGILDLAITTNGAKLDFLAGTGYGTFDPPKYFVLPAAPGSIAAADFNGDGKLDVVLGISLESVIMLGDGNGNFAPAAPYPVYSMEPTSVAVLDFNRDGIPDVALIDVPQNVVYTYSGNGDGTLAPVEGYDTGVTTLTNASLVVADMNGDGVQDIAFITAKDSEMTASTVTFLKGTSAGYFTNGGSVSTGSDPLAIVAGDWNGDGFIDVAVANTGQDSIQTYAAQVNATSTATLTPVSVPGGGSHNVFANFAGMTGQKASKSANLALSGTPIKTATKLSISPGLSVPKGQTVQYTATVTPATNSKLVETGTVTFYHAGTAFGTVKVVNGQATFSDNTLTIGSHSMTAVYSGDANFVTSKSAATILTITP